MITCLRLVHSKVTKVGYFRKDAIFTARSVRSGTYLTTNLSRDVFRNEPSVYFCYFDGTTIVVRRLVAHPVNMSNLQNYILTTRSDNIRAKSFAAETAKGLMLFRTLVPSLSLV